MFGRSRELMLLVVAVVALALAAAGCGSVDGDKAGSSEAGSTEAAPGDSTEAGKEAAPGEEAGGEETNGAEEEAGGEGEEAAEALEGEGGALEGGGESGAPAVASTSVPKKQYAKQGDAICENVPAEYNKLLAKLPKKQQQNKKVAVPKAAIPPLRTASQEFAQLGSPEGDQAKGQAIVDALEAAADAVEKDPSLPLAGPGSPFKEFNELTQKLGFKVCPQL